MLRMPTSQLSLGGYAINVRVTLRLVQGMGDIQSLFPDKYYRRLVDDCAIPLRRSVGLVLSHGMGKHPTPPGKKGRADPDPPSALVPPTRPTQRGTPSPFSGTGFTSESIFFRCPKMTARPCPPLVGWGGGCLYGAPGGWGYPSLRFTG